MGSGAELGRRVMGARWSDGDEGTGRRNLVRFMALSHYERMAQLVRAMDERMAQLVQALHER